MNIFDSISSALRGKKAPDVVALTRLLAEAGADLFAARERLAELEGGLADALIGGRRVEHRAAIGSAKADVADLESVIVSLQQRLAEAQQTEAEAARRVAFSEAMKLRTAAVERLRAEYQPAVVGLLALIKSVAEADLAVERANAALPEGEPPLANVEQVARDEPSLPKKTISTRVVSRWCAAGTATALGDERAANVVPDQDNPRSGTLRDVHGGQRHAFRVELHDFLEERFLPSRTGRSASRLADLHLPALSPADEDFWTRPGYPLDPEAILARLAARAALPPGHPERDDRKPEVVYRPVADERTGLQAAE